MTSKKKEINEFKSLEILIKELFKEEIEDDNIRDTIPSPPPVAPKHRYHVAKRNYQRMTGEDPKGFDEEFFMKEVAPTLKLLSRNMKTSIQMTTELFEDLLKRARREPGYTGEETTVEMTAKYQRLMILLKKISENIIKLP